MIGQYLNRGIGVPSDIDHYILGGLSPGDEPPPTPSAPVVGGGYPITAPPKDHRGLLNRDYRERELPKRITRRNALAECEPVPSLQLRVGLVRARGTVGIVHARAVCLPLVSLELAPVGDAVGYVSVTARIVPVRTLSADEWFLLGFVAGQADGD